MSHARLGPSGAHRWLVCPGSIRQAEGLPTGSQAAAEGTVCHDVLADRLRARTPKLKVGDSTKVEKYHVTFSADMHGWVEDVRREVNRLIDESLDVPRLAVETRVCPGKFYGVPDELWGTADVLLSEPSILTILDAKFGFHEVAAKENPQLSLYAIGGAERYGWKHDTYRLAIAQPRGKGYDEEVITRDELLDRAESYRAGVLAAVAPDAPIVPSDEGCRYCPAAGVCKPFQARAQQLALREFSEPEHLTAEELALLLDEAARIRTGLAAAEEHAERMLRTGIDVPGWKLVRAKTNRKWVDETNAQSTLELLGFELDQLAPRKFVSPAAAERLLGKAKDALEYLTTKPEGAPTLAKLEDSREALPSEL